MSSFIQAIIDDHFCCFHKYFLCMSPGTNMWMWTEGVYRFTLIKQSHTALEHKKYLNAVSCMWSYYSSSLSQHFRTRVFSCFPSQWVLNVPLLSFVLYFLNANHLLKFIGNSLSLAKFIYYLFSVCVSVGVFTCSGTFVLVRGIKTGLQTWCQVPLPAKTLRCSFPLVPLYWKWIFLSDPWESYMYFRAG